MTRKSKKPAPKHAAAQIHSSSVHGTLLSPEYAIARAALEIAEERARQLADLRSALQRGDTTDALRFARILTGLEERDAVPPPIDKAAKSRDEGLTVDITTAARVLGIGRAMAYELARNNRFPVPVLKIGRRLVISRERLEWFVRGSRAPQ